MTKNIIRFIILVAWIDLTLAASLSPARDEKVSPEDRAFFENSIRPVLVKHCYECHSADSEEVGGKFLLDTRDGIRKGGESGPALVSGKPDESRIIQSLRYDGIEMPPEKPLPEAVINDFVKWVQRGAPDPRLPVAENNKPETAPGESDATSKPPPLWSLQTRSNPAIPEVKNQPWPRDPLDRFVLARLEAAGMTPTDDADSRTLIRRLHFALLGLPPSMDEVEQFAAAYQRDGEKALCGAQVSAETNSGLTARPPTLAARAKRAIFLCMGGGPAHLDTFDYKPQTGQKKHPGSVFRFRQHGDSGLWISELLPETAKHADELCVINGMHADTGIHAQSFLQLHTGDRLRKRPGLGSWISYGLGTENQNLPGFISLNTSKSPVYSSAFLLDDTLVVWGGAFGRPGLTPDDGKNETGHNARGFTFWLAGGGAKSGRVHGKTDPTGGRAVEGKVHFRDLHATILHLLGLPPNNLKYWHAGRQHRLTGPEGGKVTHELFA